jgi:hypothetical protein
VEASRPAGAAQSGDAVWQRLEDQLQWYRTSSHRAQRAYKLVKPGQIAVGAVVPVLAATGAPGWVTAVVAATVVVAEGAQQLFQWQSNWLLYRSTSEELKRERFLYLAGAGPYTGDDRRRVLAERVEAVLAEEHRSWASERKAVGSTPGES